MAMSRVVTGRCCCCCCCTSGFTGPSKFSTVTSDAESRIPRIARIRLICQKPCVSQ